jgi:hypothetical protein
LPDFYKKALHVDINYHWVVEIAQKPESSKEFVPEKNRWQVEIGPPKREFWMAQF